MNIKVKKNLPIEQSFPEYGGKQVQMHGLVLVSIPKFWQKFDAHCAAVAEDCVVAEPEPLGAENELHVSVVHNWYTYPSVPVNVPLVVFWLRLVKESEHPL